ncbi:hypothetical protein E0500_016620 [Streptomyces sp. KM273126]|uniref:hypothetical protein n=1 Tax=Streptomyces sp. KM273126 TaxID=2545247 RepID=UPI00103DC70C|nr:hypothetical protein [Streptomyces sp. KM273126]
MTGAAPLGQAHANGPHQLRTELARQARERAAAAVRPPITMRLRRGSVRRLLGLRCGAVVLVRVHTRLLLIGGSMTARRIHSNISPQEGTSAAPG